MASLQSNQLVFSPLERGAHPKRLQPSWVLSSLAALLLPVLVLLSGFDLIFTAVEQTGWRAGLSLPSLC